MRKYIVLLITTSFLSVNIFAQEKSIKAAEKSLIQYERDQSANKEKLNEARAYIDEVFNNYKESELDAEAHLIKGSVYAALCSREGFQVLTGAINRYSNDKLILTSWKSLQTAYKLSDKTNIKKEVLKKMADIQRSLEGGAGGYIIEKLYQEAFECFEALILSHRVLKENSLPSYLDDAEEEQKIITNAFVVAGLTTGNEASAAAIFKEGRSKYPNNSSLLFEEINFLLKKEKLEEVIPLLNKAIEIEPSNAALNIALGSIFDKLSINAAGAKNDAKETEYFNAALKNFELAAEKEPQNADTWYSAGVLFYNKAAGLAGEIKQLPDDQYKSRMTEVLDLFRKALPYFKKAENRKPDDFIVLTALKNIYLQLSDDLSSVFQKRLDILSKGGKISEPFFKD